MRDAEKKLKALADGTRLRILHLVARQVECCVCEIYEVLKLTPPTASRSLHILEDAGWLAKRRDGRWMHYRLAKTGGEWDSIRARLLQELTASAEGREDLRRHRERRSRGGVCSPIPEKTAVALKG